MEPINIFQMFADATNFAKNVHKGQEYDGRPYMHHIKDVLLIALQYELNFEQIIACILHDTLEDTFATYDAIELNFGENIADLVELVTDEPGKNRKERKEATYKKLRGNPDAIAVKLCDRIANLLYSINNLNMKLVSMYIDEDGLFSLLDDGFTNRKLWNKYRSLIDSRIN